MVILLTGLAGAMLLLAQSSLGQGNRDLAHPVPDGAKAAAAAAAAADEAKTEDPTKKEDRFTYGKRKGSETLATKESTGTIQKTRDGSSDVTVPTGVFKESFLDMGLPSARTPAPNQTPSARINPVRSATTTGQASTSAQSSASPAPTAASVPTALSQLDITLGVKPAPNATATPSPR